MRVMLIICATVPGDVSQQEFANYAHDAVCSMRGSLSPTDALFHLDPDEVHTSIAISLDELNEETPA